MKIEGVLEKSPYAIKATQKTPRKENLLKIQEDGKKLDEEQCNIFYTYLMKAMILCNRARPHIYQVITFLSSIIKNANEGDYNKLL